MAAPLSAGSDEKYRACVRFAVAGNAAHQSVDQGAFEFSLAAVSGSGGEMFFLEQSRRDLGAAKIYTALMQH